MSVSPSPSAAVARPPSSTGSFVFADPSGRRWRRFKIVAILLLCAGLAFATLAWPRLTALPALPDGTRVDAVDEAALPEDLPIIGKGPLLRLMRLERQGRGVRAVEPFRQSAERALSAREIRTVGDAEYTLERYGWTPGLKRTIALTFDDGPDPVWTPRLLDLLEREQVPATFFVLGKQVSRQPELARRIVREGHAIGNHTFDHVDLDAVSGEAAHQQLANTDRVLRATAGLQTRFVRPPFAGDDDRSLQHQVRGVVRAQRLGYASAMYTFDTNDWAANQPDSVRTYRTTHGVRPAPLHGPNVVMLMHDGGGDREATLRYVADVIRKARAEGYRFVTMPEAAEPLAAATTVAGPTMSERIVLWTGRFTEIDGLLLRVLWVLGWIIMLFSSVVVIALALMRRQRPSRGKRANDWYGRRARRLKRPSGPEAGEAPLVTVALAAYNEEKVIERTMRALLASDHPNFELLVVNDGSTDGTGAILDGLAAEHPALRVLHQANAGKSAGMNKAFREARGDVVVTTDADTLVRTDTVSKLVRHFTDDSVGGVAGIIRVGNRTNLLTRCQALEYVQGVMVERPAQEMLRSIVVLPGACAAWRRRAVLAVGGFSHRTLAEDFDLTVSLQAAGYVLLQDDEAVAETEAPDTWNSLVKQRVRWAFGTMQALWVHRRMFFRPRYGVLGTVLLPYVAVTTFLPLFTPVVHAVALFAVLRGHGAEILAIALAIFALRAVTYTVACLLAREKLRYVLLTPVVRLVYEPLYIYLAYRITYTALRGLRLGWNKLDRSGTVTAVGSTVAAPERELASSVMV